MREREYNMDYLRIFACFMVIFLHVAAQNWSSVEVTGKQWHVFNYSPEEYCAYVIP